VTAKEAGRGRRARALLARLGGDGWTGLVVVAASLALFWRTLGLETNPLVPIGPAFYPRIVLGITAVFGIWLVASDLLARRGRAPEGGARPRVNYVLVALAFGVFGLYVAVLPLVGFRIATFLFVSGFNLLLAPPQAAKHWARAAAVGVVTSLAVYYVFEHYLSVLLPRGSWTGA